MAQQDYPGRRQGGAHQGGNEPQGGYTDNDMARSGGQRSSAGSNYGDWQPSGQGGERGRMGQDQAGRYGDQDSAFSRNPQDDFGGGESWRVGQAGRGMQGDFGRQRDQGDYRAGMSGQGGNPSWNAGDRDTQNQFDPDYQQWRTEQMRTLDEDYRNWRQDRYKKFTDEFSSWRNSRNASRGSDESRGSVTEAGSSGSNGSNGSSGQTASGSSGKNAK